MCVLKYRAKGTVLSRHGWVLRNTRGTSSEILPLDSAKVPECPQGCFPMLCAPEESARVPHRPTEATWPYSPPSSLFPSCLGLAKGTRVGSLSSAAVGGVRSSLPLFSKAKPTKSGTASTGPAHMEGKCRARQQVLMSVTLKELPLWEQVDIGPCG